MTSKQRRRRLLKSLSHDVTMIQENSSSVATESSEDAVKDAKVVLKRKEFICSDGHNAHLEEDYMKDESRLFGRPISSPSSKSMGRRTFKNSSFRRFFKSKSVDGQSSDDGRESGSSSVAETVERRLRRNLNRVDVKHDATDSGPCLDGTAPPPSSSDCQPPKPPRKRAVNVLGTSPVTNPTVDPAADDDAADNGVLLVKPAANAIADARGSLTGTSDKSERSNDCAGLASSPGACDAGNCGSEAAPDTRRLVRRASVVVRPLCCDMPCGYDRPRLYSRQSLTHGRQFSMESADVDDLDSRPNGGIAAPPPEPIARRKSHSSLVKRESLIHPSRPPRRRVPLGTTNLYQPLIVNGRFQNPWSTWKKPSFMSALRWNLTSRDNTSLPNADELDKTLPIIPLRPDAISSPPVEGIRVTWLGHSTVLVQLGDISVLTDPMFSDRASPIGFFGPKRFRRFPGTVYDLPKLDAVIVSHNHYDHLDYNSVLLLNARFGAELHWFVPVGLRTWMHNAGCESVTELTWWAEGSLRHSSDTTFVFTPAQHWSKRTPTDDNKVLWGSWCILGPKYRFFFAGDTGYCDVFKQIGDQFGPFDLAAIPIGAYEPRWFMHNQHIDPVEAVKIHQDVRAAKSFGIHWGTFALTNEHYLEPPQKLNEAVHQVGLSKDDFFTLKHGESRVVYGT